MADVMAAGVLLLVVSVAALLGVVAVWLLDGAGDALDVEWDDDRDRATGGGW